MAAHDRDPRACPDCSEGLSRRDFVRTVAGAALLAGAAPAALAASPRRILRPGGDPESAAKRLFDSLSSEQRAIHCKPFGDPLRTRINANWAITKPTIDDAFNSEQTELIDQIVRGLTSPDGFDRFMKQMDEDSGGLGSYHVAMFGEPGSGQFEWELTGRHVTLRADGDAVEGAAFGGPIVYGHGAGDGQKGLPGNVFYYQTQKANEVFKALDGAQRDKALVADAPREDAVKLQGNSGKFPGLGVGDLSADQKALVGQVLRTILAPYRDKDVDEAMAVVEAGGGLDALHMAFYKADDLGDDQEWDLWRVEGPTFVCHFRGAPHVHAYLNIARRPA